MKKRWRSFPPCSPDFSTQISQPETLAQLLWNRGLRTQEEIAAFLDPTWETHLHDPTQFRHLPAASERLFAALTNGERITVHGDYDADGVTGSTVLITTIRELERQIDPARTESMIDYYIPHRDKEGYGLHRATVGTLAARGTKLIITVDCGIACVDEIALARATGIDVIVVDHHQFGETLPDAHLIHPGLPQETYPFKKLAAVGVSYKFATALLAMARQRGFAIPIGWEKWLLDLVAIATVTDMVGLTGENRLLERYGLMVLNKTRRPGLQALIEAAGLIPGAIDSESIGFSIGPRLNAAGRMDHASLALRLLLAESLDEARLLAKELERCNRLRQDTTRGMMTHADAWLLQQANSPARIHVLWQEDWSPALVGLVAGRLMEKTGKPTIAIGQHEGTWIGSGRSPQGYDVTEAMRSAGEGILTRVGGHAQACGFALTDASRLEELRTKLEQHAAERLTDEQLIPEIAIDAMVSLDQIDWPLWEQIVSLEPFGQENVRPTFLAQRCFIRDADLIGTEKQHLRLSLAGPSGRPIKIMGFKQGDRRPEVKVGGFMDVVFQLSVNEWRGSKNLEGRLIDFTVLS